jgi:L-malate glycosyltransferase
VRSPLRLLLVGEGPLRPPLEALARDLGMAARVRFLGACTHQETFEWLKASDVFLGTSALTNRSLTTLEAMMCGLPVVATDAGDTRGLLRDGVDSLVTPADPEALAGALERVARDAELRERLGREARRASEAFPGWAERVGREVALYRELLEER